LQLLRATSVFYIDIFIIASGHCDVDLHGRIAMLAAVLPAPLRRPGLQHQ
jgi:hypothetical protein